MLAFERNKEGTTTCGMNGTIAEIVQDTIICIGAVHESIKQQDPKAAKTMRAAIESFCAHGSELNVALFEHFDKPEMLLAALKQESKRNFARLTEMLKEAMEAAGIDIDIDDIDLDGIADDDDD